jgi:molecular chaperone GrpE (heat shock protein)
VTRQLQTTGYWSRLLAAALGRLPPAPKFDATDAAARVAGLELELRERDQRIQQMQAEYAALQAAKERAATAAGEEHIERLFRRLAGPLSNLEALAALSEAGHQAAPSDFAVLVRALANEAARAGLERIGTVAETAGFDPSLHQRMSGGSVHPGKQVTVRMPGYRLGNKILLKAMVSAKEERDG